MSDMLLDEPELDAYTDRFTWSAGRQEINDGYAVASDDDGFQRYLANLPRRSDLGAGWHRWLAARRAERRAVYRVRVLYQEPTSFQRFEIEHEYIPNAIFGERTRILDLTEVPRPSALADAETWVLDRARVAVMTYRDDRSFAYARAYDGADAQPWVDSIDAAWDAGEDLLQWWNRHPRYHRENWPAAGG